MKRNSSYWALRKAAKIDAISEEETNCLYDEYRQNNGGGYHQPHYEVKFADGTTCDVCDESCGDFGSRITVVIGDKSAYYGSMLERSQERSDFGVKDAKYLNSIKVELGYCVPFYWDI